MKTDKIGNTGIQKIRDIAASLYDRGWRAADREQLIAYCYALIDAGAADREQLIAYCYALIDAEADDICALLEEYENTDGE